MIFFSNGKSAAPSKKKHLGQKPSASSNSPLQVEHRAFGVSDIQEFRERGLPRSDECIALPTMEAIQLKKTIALFEYVKQFTNFVIHFEGIGHGMRNLLTKQFL